MDFLLTILLGFFSNFFGGSDTLLSQIKNSGELVIATRNNPLTYYEAADGHAGFEYDLAKAFADDLGVGLRVVVPENSTDILHLVANNRVHFAAAGILMSDWRRHKGLRFGPAYYQVRTHLVGVQGGPPYRNLESLSYGPECVSAVDGTLHAEALRDLSVQYPSLSWNLLQKTDAVELLDQVRDHLADYAVVGSHELLYAQRYYPELYPLFDISEARAMAWAFPRVGTDDSLYLAAIQFFNRIRGNGELSQLIDRYYGHLDDFDYVNTRTFHRHIEERLPEYEDAFKTTAAKYQLDWLLLAAIGYQESRWNPSAVSPTGVRGLMMLTENAANEMGVDDRHDPGQSIEGGGRYLAALIARVPAEIPEPDRIWLALAAYNIGWGHVRDAQALAERNKDNPRRWIDVEKYISRLSHRRWYAQTRHGYARGFETVQFLKRIREYYTILRKINERDEATGAPAPGTVNVDSPVL